MFYLELGTATCDWQFVEKRTLGKVLWEWSLLMDNFDRTDIACLGSLSVEVLGCRILRFSAGMARFFLCGSCTMALVVSSGTPALKCGCGKVCIYGSITS